MTTGQTETVLALVVAIGIELLALILGVRVWWSPTAFYKWAAVFGIPVTAPPWMLGVLFPIAGGVAAYYLVRFQQSVVEWRIRREMSRMRVLEWEITQALGIAAAEKYFLWKLEHQKAHAVNPSVRLFGYFGKP